MIDNFDLIKEHLKFINERSFYFVQIMKRKKDNPEMKGDSIVVDNYYIFSKEQFDRVKPHIIEKCEEKRARAYIRLNCLDANSVMLRNIEIIAQEANKGNWTKMASTLNSACGACGVQKGWANLYVLDLDEIEPYSEKMEEIRSFVNAIEPSIQEDRVKLVVKTRNGCHLLITGCNKEKFKNAYPEIAWQDAGNTLLYYPEVCG